jgi:hypothetical protein
VTATKYCVLRGKPKLLNLLLEHGASLDGIRDYLDKVKDSSFKSHKREAVLSKFNAVLSKHEKWQRVKEYIKLSVGFSKV